MSGLAVWVLYERPADYPDEWVVRRQHATDEGVMPDEELAARGPTRTACEEALLDAHPEVACLLWCPRDPWDDPVIVGSWL